MLEVAETCGSDIVADNMIAFYDDGSQAEHHWVPPALWTDTKAISLENLFEGGLVETGKPEIGYLKPMIRLTALDLAEGPYREDLSIGEDFDLIARLLLNGARYHYLPDAMYRYRPQQQSLLNDGASNFR
ncbi:hypothetical protein LTR94_024634 [Friedmanniomyces endolithicus]|nr:hypothetical protein LTR94_024634 [Friedmanniomyces endolithicus]